MQPSSAATGSQQAPDAHATQGAHALHAAQPEQIEQDWRETVEHAAREHLTIAIRGGNSKHWYGAHRKKADQSCATDGGAQARSITLDTRSYRGIVDYDPAELCLTARAGTPLVEIEAALAEHQQLLPFEPPHFGPDATLGGCVAAGLSGPRRPYAGSVRDLVLGAVVLDGQGQTLHFGGRVMKNVAGYDVARLFAGSLGTLGPILQVSLKVLPEPAAQATLRFEAAQEDAIRWLNEWAGRPLPLSASAWCDGALMLRLSGAKAAVVAACAQLGGETVEQATADALWLSLREQTHPFFTAGTAARDGALDLWRLSVPQHAAALTVNDMGEQLIEWGGGQRWLFVAANDVTAATRLRDVARASGGHATRFRTFGHEAIEAAPTFTPLSPPLQAIHQRLKLAFDPQHVFNPGRLVF